MAVQKRRQSHARSASRRAAWRNSVAVPNITQCPRCQAPKASHKVCLECGYYNGAKVLDVKESE